MTNVTKIKVLHVVLSMETGGLENGIVNLVNHSDKDNFIVNVLCLRERGELANRITNKHSKVIFTKKNNVSLLTSIKDIIHECKHGQYDVIHSHGFTTMLTCHLASFFCKSTIHINGEHGTLYYNSLKKRLIQKYLFSKMILNLTVSANLKDTILTKFNIRKDNFFPIINGVDTNKFINSNNINNLRSSLGLNDDCIIIGSVGRLVSIKNYACLINAFYSVSQQNSNVHLVLAGDGPERKNLEEQISTLELNNHVHLLGRRDDITDIMPQFNIFVLPSFSEGLSNTLLEAMSCGVPAIASNVGGNKEIILDSETGYLYPSDDKERLTNILVELVNKPNMIDYLSNNARKHICNNHSINSMVNNYETTYTRLLNQNNTNEQFI